MERVLLSIIAASGLCAVSARQYHLVSELKNTTEAQSYCRERYTDLATIYNMEDVMILKNMEGLGEVGVAWIGLYDDINSWRWSLADQTFYKDGEAEFRNWGSGQPDNIGSIEHCSTFTSGLWYDRPCELHLTSVCLDVSGSSVTFVLTDTCMSWTEAQSYCREHHTDLASVRNVAENQEVQRLVPAGLTVWIGLFRDSWKWSDGSNSSFRNWNTSTEEPNNHYEEACVAVDPSGKWSDWNCDLNMSFICYTPSKTKQVMSLTLLKQNSSLDLNDPVVMEGMLKQIKQKLVDPNIELSWRKQSGGKVFHEDKKGTEKRKTVTGKEP